MKLIAECSFDLDGKTYEYAISQEAYENFQPEHHPGVPKDLFALAYKGEPPQKGFASPSDFRLVRVRRFKPQADQVFDGPLKLLHVFIEV